MRRALYRNGTPIATFMRASADVPGYRILDWEYLKIEAKRLPPATTCLIRILARAIRPALVRIRIQNHRTGARLLISRSSRPLRGLDQSNLFRKGALTQALLSLTIRLVLKDSGCIVVRLNYTWQSFSFFFLPLNKILKYSGTRMKNYLCQSIR
jgi:hypothetical protein